MVSVLLVDDAEGYRNLVVLALEDHAVDVVGEAENGAIGVEMAQDLQPDVVLLDLAMPEMDGFEALPLIRKAAPGSRVIVLTGFERDRIASRVYSLGADLVLEKGITGEELAAAILQRP